MSHTSNPEIKIPPAKQGHITHLECSGCSSKYPASEIQNTCVHGECREILLARYSGGADLSREKLKFRPFTMWRYKELLPVLDYGNIVSLGEGGTPLFHAKELSKIAKVQELYWKDEGGNPTGSFKARGMSAAISKARELGIKKVAIPTAGNAGVALAAYGARAGIDVHVVMPVETPLQIKREVRLYEAKLTELGGNIADCGKLVTELCAREGWFNVSTLKEPYRLEGKKTMGFELAEQFDWELPDVILYPTGGGTGLIGFWKAFGELEAVGWIGRKRPRLISVQSDRCDSIVTAFHKKENRAVGVDKGFTIANGLRVPKPYADKLVLSIIKQTDGYAISVSDDEILDALREVARLEGMFIAPEGAALWAALKRLRAAGLVGANEKTVLVNTGSGNKYSENIFPGENT